MTHLTAPIGHPAELQPSSLPGYLIGFVGSLVLTVSAYLLVVTHVLGGSGTVVLLVGFAMIQLVVQLIFFLHLASPSQERWRVYVLLAMLAIVLIVVFGSLWIMGNLNTRMSPTQQEQYMNGQGGL